MNYIHRMQAEAGERQQAQEQALQAADELRSYLVSPKFQSGDTLDGYVQVNDVLVRLAEVTAALRG